MRYIHRDAAELLIALTDHPDLIRRLHEIKGVRSALRHESRHAERHAARPRREGDLAGQHFVTVFFHAFLDPGLQVRIAEISNPVGWLRCNAVGNEGIAWILGCGAGLPARYGFEEGAIAVEPHPSHIVR